MGLAQLTLDASDVLMATFTIVIALVGSLLSYQLKQRDARNAERDANDKKQDEEISQLLSDVAFIKQATGLTTPSDYIRKMRQKPSEGSSA